MLHELILDRRSLRKPWLIVPTDPIRDSHASVHSYAEICSRAEELASSLRAIVAHRQPTPVVLVFDNDDRFCVALLAAVLADLIPVCHAPPTLQRDYESRLRAVVETSRATVVLFADEYGPALRPLDESVLKLPFSEAERGPGPKAQVSNGRPNTSLLQFSSGSTRAPTGITLSHRALLNNVASIGERVGASGEEVVVSWLPVSHDMGLIGSLLYSFFWKASLVLMSPMSFVSKPIRWLWAISRFRGTASAAPNFAYAQCANVARVREDSLVGLDLSSWRVAINGSEPVQPDTIQRFTSRFAKYGFEPHAMCPAYGLAENCVACCISSPREALQYDFVAREALHEGLAVPSSTDSAVDSCSFVSVGRPLVGTELRVVGDAGEPLGERAIGELQFRGNSRMRGYWPLSEPSSAHQWVATGDIGYRVASQYYIVGRKKEIIKRAGVRFDASEAARVISNASKEFGRVCVLGIPDAELGTERVVVLAEVNAAGQPPRHLRSLVLETAAKAFTFPVDDIVLLARGSLPRTTSGKLRIPGCADLYSQVKNSREHPTNPSKGRGHDEDSR